MNKIIVLLLAAAMLVPATAFAFNDGAVIQPQGLSRRYLIKDGTKWLIKSNFTLRELGFSKKDIRKVSKEEARAVPDGEAIRISPPQVAGIYDMHEHYQVGGDMKLYFEVARELRIKKTLFVPTGKGPDNEGYKENMKELLDLQRKNPDRIVAFCTVDEADEKAPEIFEECLKDGGRGLKLMVGHPNFYDAPVNSPIVKALFALAQEYDVPVLVHISIINLPETVPQFMEILDEYPTVRVQFAHYCSSVMNGVNLNKCAEFLDKYDNVYIDISMGGGIGRYFQYMTQDITPIKEFVEKYQTRVMYGTDIILSKSANSNRRDWVRGRIMCDLSLHQEKWYRCPVANKGEYTLLPGFNFDKKVLENIYIKTPEAFLKAPQIRY